MPPHPETESRFGRELRSARTARGVSLDRLADEMKARGYRITGANIGGWERGEHAPKSSEPVVLIESILKIEDGRLHDAMGWRRADERSVSDLVDGLTAEVRQLQQMLRKHLRDHKRDAP